MAKKIRNQQQTDFNSFYCKIAGLGFHLKTNDRWVTFFRYVFFFETVDRYLPFALGMHVKRTGTFLLTLVSSLVSCLDVIWSCSSHNLIVTTAITNPIHAKTLGVFRSCPSTPHFQDFTNFRKQTRHEAAITQSANNVTAPF